MIKDVVIIAAGKGTRLKSLGPSKPLVPLAGRSLIEWALDSAFTAGVERAIVVTGFEAAHLEDHLHALQEKHHWPIATVYNPDYDAANGLSVLCARPHVTGAFFLAMCDHLASPRIYRTLNNRHVPNNNVALGVDRRLKNPMIDLNDVTRVRTEGELIRDIGKLLPAYDAYDTGIFLASAALFEALEDAGEDEGDFSISGGMKQLAAQDRAMAVDIGDAFWIDVDDPSMHALAEAWLGVNVAAIP